MKFEIKPFKDKYDYLVIYYMEENSESYKKLPMMLNLTLATKEEILAFVEWADKCINKRCKK